MSAERLRAAAALLRERGEAATPGPWEAYGDHLVWPGPQGPATNDPILALMGEAHQESAAYVATVHPGFGLAVAGWLESYATRLDVLGHAIGSNMGDALAVADAVLGGER